MSGSTDPCRQRLRRCCAKPERCARASSCYRTHPKRKHPFLRGLQDKAMAARSVPAHVPSWPLVPIKCQGSVGQGGFVAHLS